MSYIPETSWNDSAAAGSPASGGGGASIYFPKPAWQFGVGVPSDGVRDVPDIALDAGVQHDSYLIYSSNALTLVGGTSAASQVFGGILALLNQYVVQNGGQATPGLGNVNPKLYQLAQTPATYASAFHDITTGNNIVTPQCQGRGCTATPIGFNAGVGYDLATGLGSVDVFNLLTAWNGTPGLVVPQIAVSASATALTTSRTDHPDGDGDEFERHHADRVGGIPAGNDDAGDRAANGIGQHEHGDVYAIRLATADGHQQHRSGIQQR